MLYEIIIDQSLEISNSQFTSYQSRPFDSLRCKMMRYLSVWRPKMCSKYNCPANFSPPPEVFHLLRCRSTAFFSDQRLGKTCDDLERLHGMPWAFRPNHVRIIFWPDIKLHLHVHGSCCFRLFRGELIAFQTEYSGGRIFLLLNFFMDGVNFSNLGYSTHY